MGEGDAGEVSVGEGPPVPRSETLIGGTALSLLKRGQSERRTHTQMSSNTVVPVPAMGAETMTEK